jgi:hypothetical protein
MMKLEQWACGLALAVGCATAGAGMHQICYEGPPEFKNGAWVPNGIFGCAIDGAGSCTINTVSNGMVSRTNAYPLNQGVASAGTFRYFDFTSSAGTFTARMDFFDANSVKVGERRCTVNAVGVFGSTRGAASPGAVLTGFSSDESGLVSTGVWRLQAGVDSSYHRLAVQAPADFVAVGGGAMGTNAPAGALITGSTRYATYSGDERSWRAITSEVGAAQPHRAVAYVIGMRIEGMHARDLAPLLQTVTATSSPTIAAHNAAQAVQPVIGGSVVLSGSIEAIADGSNALNMLGQFATVSAPVIGNTLQCQPTSTGFWKCRSVPATTGWRVESKDHVVPHAGWVNAQMHALPLTITVAGVSWEVRGKSVSATSAVAAHPAADVSGLRGEYALTGIGATVDWRRFDQFGNQTAAGSLLWKLEPRADLGGASVASKDHIISSPASVTAHALGIKLVPPGTPSNEPICCYRL